MLAGPGRVCRPLDLVANSRAATGRKAIGSCMGALGDKETLAGLIARGRSFIAEVKALVGELLLREFAKLLRARRGLPTLRAPIRDRVSSEKYFPKWSTIFHQPALPHS